MSTTLRAESFADINILELTVLTADAAVGATTITAKSTVGFTVGQAIYIGTTAREDACELVYVQTVASATSLTLSSGLTLPHSKYEPVTGVVGDKVRIYRAANVDGTTPADTSFAVLAARQIDPDHQSTYYADSTGSSSYWYKMTYYNATTLTETDLAASTAVRGDDFGHYVSLSEIRNEAGFANAVNLRDTVVDQQRRAAESEINSALAKYYTTPFSPVPAMIETLTIQLAAGLLLNAAYGGSSTQGKTLVKDARDLIARLQSGDTLLDDDAGADALSEGVSSWPDDTTADADVDDGGSDRVFRMGDQW